MDEPSTDTGTPAATEDKAARALENLRMRLLDLTARNRLINFRHSRSASLRIIDELPDQLVETLLADREMRFAPVPEPTREALIDAGYLGIDRETGQEIRLGKDPTAEEWAQHLGLSTAYEVPLPGDDTPEAKHADAAIQTLLYPYELEARLKNLLLAADSAIEEMGANILYLACGFLEWLEPDGDTARIAPLFLVPVRLHKGRLNPVRKTYEYTLGYSGEDIISNLSLREKLRADFSLALPELDEEIAPEAYFRAVGELVRRNQPRWRVRRYVTLALLNFSRLLMYLDLDPAHWPQQGSILDHRVVSRFLAGYRPDEGEAAGTGLREEHAIDDLADIHARYPLVDDADSSQHSALIDAVDGRDLVIEGPPGTGKSQTITNLIAAALARGRRVLFVAEKLAALEVVRRRLNAVGLGDFCLELHSHKAQKRRLLDEVDERLNRRGGYRDPRDIDADIARLEELKGRLREHVERINRPWKATGRTLHQIFTAATRYRGLVPVPADSLHPAGYDGDSYDPAARRRTGDQVQAYRKIYGAVARQLDGDGDLGAHPWYGVRNGDLQMFDLDRVAARLGDWQAALERLAALREATAADLGCDAAELPDALSGLTALADELERVPVPVGDELLDRLPLLRGEALDDARHHLALFEHIQADYDELGGLVDRELLRDPGAVDAVAAGGEQLAALAAPEADVPALVAAYKRLEAVAARLRALDEPLAEVQRLLGAAADDLLPPTLSGYRELGRFIELAGQLGAGHWKVRDPAFDNDELDELLPALRRELDGLHELRGRIGTAFDVRRLPSPAVLRAWVQTLSRGGLFAWLSGDWRAARRQLLGHAVAPGVGYPALRALLGEAVRFVEQREALERNARYRAALGERVQGLETDIQALESVRGWYRRVRAEYGVGFGRRVALGDALIGLPANLARALRTLAQQDVSERIRACEAELRSLRAPLSPVAELGRDDLPLTGDDALLHRLSTRLAAALAACAPADPAQDATVDGILTRIDQLKALTADLAQWHRAEREWAPFQGLDLQPGPDADNRAALSAAKNTLALAVFLDRELAAPAVQAHLYAQPGADAFERVRQSAEGLRTALASQHQALDGFAGEVDLDREAWTARCGERIASLAGRNRAALEDPDALQNWLDYVRVRDQLGAMGLGGLADGVERGSLAIGQVDDAHRAGIYDLLAREILREQPQLGRFSGHSQQALQEQFATYDNRLKRLQSERIAWRIDQRAVPEGCPGPRAGDRTELYLLKHECGKKTRHLPIRQIVQRAAGALSALKPCFMMGPMSVAQYLAPGQVAFDLVVMDEASQIKPQDALGAIARGAQAVVVGDPKQLPPTSFFDRVVDDDEPDPAGIEESESILDATRPLFPTRRLRWHYRSQHESLIAFSNHAFYEGDLILFPSPHKQTERYGIQYSRVARGCFVNRRNLEEARIISRAVREHLHRCPDESLGVVAMSAEQRRQIAHAIETLAKEDEAFGERLERDAAGQEPLFVKNLENVQGDERDVIFISMTYGPQEPGGPVHQRFGPINSDVGWRRLNVLFTRSRRRMHVFSSMGADDVLAGGTAKRGVQALRDFLRYGETGQLQAAGQETGRAPDSDFEIGMADALGEAGFDCVPQVGVAGFFIDLAVVDPGNPGRYLLGIECDGATYHAARSVRDRDRLRQAVLERLGWRIRRIWSTDWFKNPHAELQPILRELEALKSGPRPEEPTAGPSDEEGIRAIVERVDADEGGMEAYVTGADLRAALEAFDRTVVRAALPDTPPQRRLLRPAMLEALLEYRPTSKADYLERIPAYLRQAGEPAEERFLEQVFEIVNASLEAGERPVEP